MPRFSRDRITSLAAEITAALKKEPGVKFIQSELAVKTGVVRALTNEINLDDKFTAAAKKKIAAMRAPPAEGTVPYNALLDQFYHEELSALRKIR